MERGEFGDDDDASLIVPAQSRKIVGMGGCNVDYLASIASFPKPDDKLRTEKLEVCHPSLHQVKRGRALEFFLDHQATLLHQLKTGARWRECCQCAHSSGKAGALTKPRHKGNPCLIQCCSNQCTTGLPHSCLTRSCHIPVCRLGETALEMALSGENACCSDD